MQRRDQPVGPGQPHGPAHPQTPGQPQDAGQVEQEVKLDVGRAWSVPDLSGVLAGVNADPIAALALEATYYDTAEGSLSRHRVTLRCRAETEVAGSAPALEHPSRRLEWTLKLPYPTKGAVLVRRELNWPVPPEVPPAPRRRAGVRPSGRAASAPTAGPGPVEDQSVHPEAALLVRALTLGQPLVPIAYLATLRQRVELRTSDGRRLAEVDHDSVAGRRLQPGQVAALGPPASDIVRFDEVEVELAPGSPLEVLDAVVSSLRHAGARPSAKVSKLSTVLGGRAEGQGPGPGAGGRAAPSLLAEVLQGQARACLDDLAKHDIALRLEEPDPEHIHRARVAVRRLRAIIGAFDRHIWAPAGLDETTAAWVNGLEGQLRWLGAALGHARDSDVRLSAIEARCLELPLADALGAEVLMGAAEAQQRQAHQELLGAMEAGRYLEVLQAVYGLARPDGAGALPVPRRLWELSAGPAAGAMHHMARREWRVALKAFRRLGDKPTNDALHQLRIKAKRLRYVCEMARPVLGPGPAGRAAKATMAATTELQDILGLLHDEVVMEAWLRQVVGPGLVPAAQRSAVGVAAGQLIATARTGQEKGRRDWLPAWEKLAGGKTSTWLG